MAATNAPAAELKATTEDSDGAAAVSPPLCVGSAELKVILSTPNAAASSEVFLR